MPKYHIGTLDAASRAKLSEPPTESKDSAPTATFLNPRSWKTAVLSSKRRISADTFVFTFDLDHPSQTLGLPTGQHLMIRLRDPATREAIIRPYTPISHVSKKGSMDVLIKLYLATSPTTPGGKMSQAISSIPVGHGVDFKGPIGKFTYHGQGVCSVNERQRRIRKFSMICGGSGITPIFQVFRSIMMDPEDPTVCTVLNGNRLIEDILCREDLDALLQGNEHRAEIVHTLSRPPEIGWDGLKGRIDLNLVQGKCGTGDFTIGGASKQVEKEVEKTTSTAKITTTAHIKKMDDVRPTDGKDALKADAAKSGTGTKTNGSSNAAATDKANHNDQNDDDNDNDGESGTMVLVCGPEPMEKSVHGWLKEIGWREEDILFF